MQQARFGGSWRNLGHWAQVGARSRWVLVAWWWMSMVVAQSGSLQAGSVIAIGGPQAAGQPSDAAAVSA